LLNEARVERCALDDRGETANTNSSSENRRPVIAPPSPAETGELTFGRKRQRFNVEYPNKSRGAGTRENVNRGRESLAISEKDPFSGSLR